jgi:hypothetical protein
VTHTPFEIDDFRRGNLLKLAEYLEHLPPEREFDMSTFADRYDLIPFTLSVAHRLECGTIGCAVGHGPCAGIDPEPGEEWTCYSDRVFVEHGSDEWDWLFDMEWADVDNTPQGAAARIRYLLEHGLPYDWQAQHGGAVSLCYGEAVE